jgi:hypothetical protein
MVISMKKNLQVGDRVEFDDHDQAGAPCKSQGTVKT